MRFARFFAWWPWRRTVRLEHLRFVLYTRQGCHLCETAHEELEKARQREGFVLATVDIDTDTELAARYGKQVPVVVVNDVVRFRGGVNRVLLDRLLHAERRRLADKGTR
jgi:glutaredoxin